METKELHTTDALDFGVFNGTLLSAFRKMVDEGDWARARGMVALFPELEAHWEHVREKCTHLHRARVLRLESMEDADHSVLLYSKQCAVDFIRNNILRRRSDGERSIRDLYAFFSWELEDDPEEYVSARLESLPRGELERYIIEWHSHSVGEYASYDEWLESPVHVEGIRTMLGINSKEETLHTRLTYNYTSAANYKQSETFWVEGVLTFADLRPYLEDDMYFTAREVGLDVLPLRFGRLHRDEDHPWHHFTEVLPSVRPLHVDQMNKVLCTAGEFVQRFKEATWDEYALEDFFDDE